MTFSILARDPDSGTLGAAAATGNLAVGAWVLAGEPDIGLVASQGFSTSTIWKDNALDLLAKGHHPDSIIDELVYFDSGRDYRQLIIMDKDGNSAGWTGDNNTEFKCHQCAANIAIAGNWLASDQVLPALKDGFTQTEGSLATRLLSALKAADQSGADKRGTWSAAIKVVHHSVPPLDLRIDYSKNPILDLTQLYKRTTEDPYGSFLSRIPTKKDPYRC